jgi:hypothetical protein
MEDDGELHFDDEDYCENTVRHGLNVIGSAIASNILNELNYWRWKIYLEPKHNRELMRKFGTIHPTWEQIFRSLPPGEQLIHTTTDEQIVDICKRETVLFDLIPMGRVS